MISVYQMEKVSRRLSDHDVDLLRFEIRSLQSILFTANRPILTFGLYASGFAAFMSDVKLRNTYNDATPICSRLPLTSSFDRLGNNFSVSTLVHSRRAHWATYTYCIFVWMAWARWSVINRYLYRTHPTVILTSHFLQHFLHVHFLALHDRLQ